MHHTNTNFYDKNTTVFSENGTKSYKKTVRKRIQHETAQYNKMPANNATTSFADFKFGRGSKNRTHDTRFWRPLLYQLSYTPK